MDSDEVGVLVFLIGIVLIAISCVVGSFGQKRQIGFWGAFWASFLLSPLMGMLFVLASDKGVPVKRAPVYVDPAKIKALNKRRFKWISFLLALVVVLIVIGQIRNSQYIKEHARQGITDVQSLTMLSLNYGNVDLSHSLYNITYKIPYEINGHSYFEFHDVEIRDEAQLNSFKDEQIAKFKAILKE